MSSAFPEPSLRGSVSEYRFHELSCPMFPLPLSREPAYELKKTKTRSMAQGRRPPRADRVLGESRRAQRRQELGRPSVK